MSSRGEAQKVENGVEKESNYPMDPFVLKRVRRVNSVRAVNVGTAIRKRYGDCSEMLVFPRKRTEKRYGKSKTMAVAKYYGFERRTIFSTEGSFG